MIAPPRSSTSGLLLAIFAGGAVVGSPRIARADDDDTDAPPAESAAPRSAEAGAFLASALSPRADGRRGLVAITGGWDRARGGAIYDAAAEARLLGPVSLLAGATYDGPGTSASPRFELRLDALRQSAHGLDVAVAAGYSGASFNMVPAAVLKLAVGRTVGATYLLANAAYEHGLEDGERSGELRAAALYPITRTAQIGLDSRLQIDLEHDHDPTEEPDWESRSGVVASYAWNRFVLTGSAGIAALRFHTGSTAVGPAITAGLGTVF